MKDVDELIAELDSEARRLSSLRYELENVGHTLRRAKRLDDMREENDTLGRKLANAEYEARSATEERDELAQQVVTLRRQLAEALVKS